VNIQLNATKKNFVCVLHAEKFTLKEEMTICHI